MAALSRFKFVVRNTSGGTLSFGYLPLHGATLADQADFIWPGNLIAYLAKDPRAMAAFDADVDNNRLTIIQTGTIVLRDTVTGAVKQLVLTSGAIVLSDPPDGAYTGSAPNV